MRAVVASLLVLLIALLVGRCLTRSRPATDAAALLPPADVSEARAVANDLPSDSRQIADELETEPGTSVSIPGRAADTRKTALRVRSSIGLPLPYLEVRSGDSVARRIGLDRGLCAPDSLTFPCRVRAPGHVETQVTAPSAEIVLEPDAALILEADGIRECVRWIRPSDAQAGNAYAEQNWDESRMSPELRNAIAWGFASDDRWACAVSSDLIHSALHSDPVEWVLRWRDGRRADIHFVPNPGVHATWSVPCDQLAVSADLDVRLVRPDTDVAGPIALRLWRIADRNADAHTETHSWGRVVFYDRERYEEIVRIPNDGTRARFESVPVGTRLSMFARDEESSAYGRLVFAHDGAERTLELRRAFEASGRVVSRDPAVPVTSVDAQWQFRDGGRVVRGWHADSQALVIPSDGSFRLHGPRHLLVNPAISLEPPAHLLLRLEAPGFEPFEQLYDTGGAARFDCGEIVLVPTRAEFVLAPGHGLSQGAVRWGNLKLSAAPEIVWTVRHAAPTPDGGLAIFLARSEKEPALFDTRPGPPSAIPDSASERILIHATLENDDEPRAFERALDGRYVAVPRREIELELECRDLPGDGRSWFVGWQWHEIWDTCEQVPAYEHGRTVRARFSAPIAGAVLFWSASGNPPRAGNEPGGTLPLEALPAKLVLR